MHIAGCSLLEIAERFGTPCFVVSEDELRERCRRYLAASRHDRRPVSIVFATKSCTSVPILRIIAEEGLGADATTIGELELVRRAGFPLDRVLWNGNGRSGAEMARAVELGVGLVICDSLDDVELLDSIATQPLDVAVRVRPDIDVATHPSNATGHRGSKFGIELSSVPDALAAIRSSRYLRTVGIHAHVGSQIVDLDAFRQAVARLANLGEFQLYDIGGGLGVQLRSDDPSVPTIEEHMRACLAAADDLLPPDARLVVEPGRSIVGPAGITVYSVSTVKPGTPPLVAVDGGTSDNFEAVTGEVEFELWPVIESQPHTACDVVGRHCDSGDVLARGVALPDVRRGDLLAMPGTGAYAHSMASNYNAVARPPIVVCRDGSARLVVRRETIEDLFTRDVVDEGQPSQRYDSDAGVERRLVP